jgi:hypothetical protein
MRTPERRELLLYSIAFSVIVLLSILFLQSGGKKVREAALKSPTALPDSPSKGAEGVSNAVSEEPQGLLQQRQFELSISNRLQEREQLREEGRKQWQTPIEFYGRVLDHEDQPVEGARVRFSCNDLSPEGTSNYETQSDADGLFSITGIKGKVLLVDVTKNGYHTVSQGANAFFYAGRSDVFTPDMSDPVVFKLRKQGKAEPLVEIEFPGIAKVAKLKPDGTPTIINLLGQLPEAPAEGELTLSFTRKDAAKKRFDYALQLSIPGGGLIERDDHLLFDPPESGYSPTVQYFVPAEKENWRLNLNRKFYIKLPNGNFGRLEVSLYAHNGVFRIRSAVNPTGSRNLEGSRHSNNASAFQ